MPGLRGTPEVMTTTSESGRVGVVAAADQPRVGALDRARLEHVERHARRLLVGDVDDDDVGQLLDGDGARHGGADVAGAADHGDFAVHGVGFCRYMFSMIASANCDVLSSVAPSIWRARS